ncbi:hypothetical protein Tco_0682849 [Tanacetum coccineum]|uniref:Uncharacterized protein n=1 Tax=Tanacetum coccineum TaxID=301880 RepID=A0ABQ4XSC7_9ASTR
MSDSSNTTFEFDVNHNGEFKLNPLTYQDGSVLNIHVFQMDFEDMVSYLKWKIPRGFTTLYYMLPPYYTLSGMKQIKNDYHTNVMYDIAKVAGKLQIFVSHTQIDLSTVLIPNDGSLEESFAANEACQAIVLKLQRETQTEETLADQLSCNLARYTEETQALDEEAILEEQMLALMHRFADRFTDRRVEINNPMVAVVRWLGGDGWLCGVEMAAEVVMAATAMEMKVGMMKVVSAVAEVGRKSPERRRIF